jgi:hypothetical protein
MHSKINSEIAPKNSPEPFTGFIYQLNDGKRPHLSEGHPRVGHKCEIAPTVVADDERKTLKLRVSFGCSRW